MASVSRENPCFLPYKIRLFEICFFVISGIFRLTFSGIYNSPSIRVIIDSDITVRKALSGGPFSLDRLIVCDIDNTLLPAGGKISDETMAAIRSLPSSTGFTIATGRSFHVVRKFVEEFGLSAPVITSNGAQVYDYSENTSIYENCFPDDVVSDLMETLISRGFDFVAYGKDGIFHRPDSAHMAFFNNYNASVRQEIRAPLIPLNEEDLSVPPEMLTKVLVYEPTDDLIQVLSARKALEITASMHKVIDIMPAGCTKGNAVVALASYLHVPMESVFCFGDGDNDISMFTCGAVGIAMGNASDKAKSYASIITRNCKDDGVAYAIRHLI